MHHLCTLLHVAHTVTAVEYIRDHLQSCFFQFEHAEGSDAFGTWSFSSQLLNSFLRSSLLCQT